MASTDSLKCFCGRIYPNTIDLEEHRIARGHFASHECKALCRHPAAPVHDGKIHTCGLCHKTYHRLDIFQDHATATGHCYCADCSLTFKSPEALIEHRNTKMHASEFKCCDCDESFGDIHALLAHMGRVTHKKMKKKSKKQVAPKNVTDVTPKISRCEMCERQFKSVDALSQHLASVRHNPLSNLSCPFSEMCRANFTSPSALVHHLESGKCQSGLDHDKVFQLVQSCDTDGIIHERKRLEPSTPTSLFTSNFGQRTPSLNTETWMACSPTTSEWSILTPAMSEASVEDSLEQWLLLSSSQISSEVQIEAITIPNLRCPLCPKARQPFKTQQGLEQHLASPHHAAKFYHCPINLPLDLINSTTGDKKRKHFATLGGLTQHLESGICNGGTKAFRQCMSLIQGHLEQLGLGGMRVLL